MKGTLYLIPCPIAEDIELNISLPEGNRAVVDSLDYFIVENVRTARRFLSRLKLSRKIDELEFVELNEHTTSQGDIEAMIAPLLKGRSGGVISEAGVPAVADPGAQVVEVAHRKGLIVKPLVGPSSIIMAVMASGLNGQSFAFNGYLPIKPDQRGKAIRNFERRAHSEGQSQLFIEAPYRNIKLLEQLLSTLAPTTLLTIAADITSQSEYIRTQSVAVWRASTLPDIQKRPTIFIIG